MYSFVLAVLLATGQGNGIKVYAAKEGGAKVIGAIRWVITDRAGKVLGKGDKKVLLRDVSITVRDGEPGGNKRIRLSNHFSLEMSEQPPTSKQEVSGFGMVSSRDDVDTFCWEWFVVDRPGHATKLQETGDLGIALTQVGGYWEVTRTNFLQDISFRVNPMTDSPGEDARWRVKILKGSTVTWPSVVKGKFVAGK